MAVKSGPPDRIAREAEVLRQLHDVAGVVRLAEVHPDGRTVSTMWVGSETLLTLVGTGLPPDRVAHLVAATASVVADLHELGYAHRRIEPSHALVSGDEVLLTGFADAGPGDRAAQQLDVVALGGLITSLLGPATIAPRPSPRRTMNARLLAKPSCEPALRNLARRAADTAAEPPCSAAEVARTLRDLSRPTTPSPEPIIGESRPRSPWRFESMNSRAVLVAAVSGLLLVATIVAISRSGGEPAASPADNALADGLPATTVTGPTSSIETATSADAAPTTPETTPPDSVTELLVWSASACAADCLEAVVLGSSELDIGGVRYQLTSDPGDLVVTGDWDCDGSATPAVLRGPSGVVDRFTTLPAADRPLEAVRLETPPGLVSLRARTAQGCSTLFGVDASGLETVLP